MLRLESAVLWLIVISTFTECLFKGVYVTYGSVKRLCWTRYFNAVHTQIRQQTRCLKSVRDSRRSCWRNNTEKFIFWRYTFRNSILSCAILLSPYSLHHKPGTIWPPFPQDDHIYAVSSMLLNNLKELGIEPWLPFQEISISLLELNLLVERKKMLILGEILSRCDEGLLMKTMQRNDTITTRCFLKQQCRNTASGICSGSDRFLSLLFC